MVSLHSQALNNTPAQGVNQSTDPVVQKLQEHEWWILVMVGRISSTIYA
jgi:hypothetical protein